MRLKELMLMLQDGLIEKPELAEKDIVSISWKKGDEEIDMSFEPEPIDLEEVFMGMARIFSKHTDSKK